MKKTIFRYDVSLLFVLIVVLLSFLIYVVVLYEGRKDFTFLVWLITVGLISMLFSAVSSVQISNEEITVTNWSGRRTLSWAEITEVSFHFSELRLYNSTHNKMLAVDLGVHDHETILETIMQRRYDLFRDNVDFTISGKVFVPPYWGTVVTLIFISISVYRGTNSWIPILIYYAIFRCIIFFVGISEIQTIKDNLHVKRSLRTISYVANEVASISLERRYTFRMGTRYDVPRVHLKNGKTIDVEAGRMGAFVYRQLATWHATHGV